MPLLPQPPDANPASAGSGKSVASPFDSETKNAASRPDGYRGASASRQQPDVRWNHHHGNALSQQQHDEAPGELAQRRVIAAALAVRPDYGQLLRASASQIVRMSSR